MTSDRIATDAHVRRWWTGFTVALLLLLPADLLTTFVSVALYGTAVETNPVMRWLLEQGFLAVTLAHLAVVVFAVPAFDVAIESVRDAPASYRLSLAYGVDVWVAFVVAVGVLIVANNLVVVF